jgi:flagellar hook-associated protein 1 FlgK
MTTSIGSILSKARTAMSASQTAIDVVSHNVANASTEGYSRQRAELVAATPQITPNGIIGRGVEVNDIARLRDSLLDITYRNETSGSAYWQRRGTLLGQVEALHGDLGAPGLSSALDQFWTSWSDLANDPTNNGARTLVKSAAEDVIAQLTRLSNGLDQIQGAGDLRLRADVDQVNQLTSNIAALNKRIVAAEAGGYTAGDLRDARDLAIDQLATFASVQVVQRGNGSVGVSMNGISVVDGEFATKMVVDTTGGVYSLRSSNGAIVANAGGALGANISVLNTEAAATRSELDAIARELAIAVNSVHQTGMNAAGQTNVLFFDDMGGNPAGITARNLSLSAAVLANSNAIAAGTPATDPVTGNPVYGAGRNDIALALSQLRDTPVAALQNQSIGGAYASSGSRIGRALRSAQDNEAVHTTLAGQADMTRSSVSGVNIDEEMVNLIRFQNAYAAAARLVTTADEMMQTILDMKR